MSGWNDNTQILTYPFTKIAANGQGDLQRALRTTKTKQSELFAITPNIWAKYKQTELGMYMRTIPTAAGWARRNALMESRMYGFFDDNQASLPNRYDFGPTSPNRFQKFYEDTVLDAQGKPLNGWAWHPARTFKRALDFHGYRANAGHPVAIAPTDPGSFSRQYSSTYFMFTIAQLVHDATEVFSGDDGQLSLYDFPDLRGKYFGVLLQNVNDPNKQLWKTSDVQLGANTVSMSVSLYPYYFPAGWLGDFAAYFFFTGTQIPQGTSSEGAVCYPIPGCEICIVNIVETQFAATIKAYKTGLNAIRAEYTITNLSNSAHTFTTNEMRCRWASVTDWNTVETAEESAQNKDLGSKTVAAGETISGTVNFVGIDPSLYMSCRIWGKFGSTEVNPFSVAPITPLPPDQS